MIETCPKDTETYFHGLLLAKSGDNLNMKINIVVSLESV